MPGIIAGGGFPNGGMREWLRRVWRAMTPGVPPYAPVGHRAGRILAVVLWVVLIVLTASILLARLG